MNRGIKYTLIGLFFGAVLFFFFDRFLNSELNIIITAILSLCFSFFLFYKKWIDYSISQVILVFGFISILFIPFFGEKQSESLEKRDLEPFPEFRWSNVWKFFKGYQSYFDDRFTLKNEIVSGYGSIKYEKLSLNNLTPQVAFGKDGWLFFNEEKSIKHISKPFTNDELKKINYNLTVITTWFAEHEIKYYLTFPPSKPSVHFEKLPDYLKTRLSYSSSDQLYNYLKENSKLNYINFVEELREEKKANTVYLKYDTHWNERGAYIGYKKIMDVIHKDFSLLKPYELNDFNIDFEEITSGDLLHLLGYETKQFYKEETFTLKNGQSPILTFSDRLPDEPDNNYQIFEMETDTNGYNIYVIRDSYSENLKKFLSLNFNKSVYDWTSDISIPRINQHQPDIILHEILERFSYEYLNLPDEIKNDTLFLSRFNLDDF